MWRIPLSDLNYDEAEQTAVADVLRSGWLTMGPKTEEFEMAMAAMLGVQHAVAVSNCTCALELAYAYTGRRFPRANQKHRPVILVPDVTFVATASAAVAAGFDPVLIDGSSPASPFPDFAEVARLLHLYEGRVAAVVVVHYAGIDHGVETVADVCREQGVPLIEDVAHAPGARSAAGKALGSVGHTGCFSFFSNKNLATGEGGLLATDDPEAADWYRQARSHGMTASTWKRHSGKTSGYDVLEPGRNFRCTEITAALGITQLNKLTAGNERRRDIARKYRHGLSPAELAMVPASDDEINRSACHLMPLVCRDQDQRERIRIALADKGIQTSHHYPPIHTLSWYASRQDLHTGLLANAEAFARCEITLPLYPTMLDSSVDEVIAVVLKAAG